MMPGEYSDLSKGMKSVRNYKYVGKNFKNILYVKNSWKYNSLFNEIVTVTINESNHIIGENICSTHVWQKKF